MSPPSDLPRTDVMVITGASGWLGQNLVRAVAPERSSVRCLVRTDEEAALLGVVGPSVQAVVGDVRDPSALDRLFEGAAGATVVHAAAIIHPEKRVQDLHDVNVGGTQLVLDRVRRHRAGRLVHISSNSPYGANPTVDHRFTEASTQHPYMGYGRSKADAEVLVKTAFERGDVESVVLRPPWFYGPHQPARQTQWIRTVRRGRFPLVGDGHNRRSMVFTGNLVHAVQRAEVAEGAAGKQYWIADGDPLDMRQIIATVRAALEAEGLPVSGKRQLRLPRLAGVVAEHIDGFLQSHGKYLQAVHVLGELKDTIACDVSLAREELGYDPPTDLMAGMRASIRWCVERGQDL